MLAQACCHLGARRKTRDYFDFATALFTVLRQQQPHHGQRHPDSDIKKHAVEHISRGEMTTDQMTNDQVNNLYQRGNLSVCQAT